MLLQILLIYIFKHHPDLKLLGVVRGSSEHTDHLQWEGEVGEVTKPLSSPWLHGRV